MVDSYAADFVETATSRLFDLEYHSPARLLTPTVDRHLDLVTSLLSVTRHEGVRQRLMRSSGATALLAAWLAFDRGDSPSANRFWEASIGAAEGTRDAGLLSASLTCQSYAALRRGDPGTAWQLAYAAGKHVPSTDPRAASWVMARVALYAAQLGEQASAEAALRYSLDLGGCLPCPRPGDGGVPWTRSFDVARLMSSTAHTAALLGDPNAIDYATKAVEALSPARVKSRAVILAEAAFTAALVGEHELCLDWGSAAVMVASELEARAKAMGNGAARVWNPRPQHPALIIITDEYAELAENAPLAANAADSVARRGRALAVTELAATQRPTQRAMGKGALRSQMHIRIALRVRERRDTDLILGQGMLAAGWHAHTLDAPGKFLISAEGLDHPRRARGFLVTDEDVASEAARWAPVRPSLDDLSAAAVGTAYDAEADGSGDALEGEIVDRSVDTESVLWTALREAPDEGVTIPELIMATGMQRTWIYLRLQQHARAGRAVQVSRGRWRAAAPYREGGVA